MNSKTPIKVLAPVPTSAAKERTTDFRLPVPGARLEMQRRLAMARVVLALLALLPLVVVWSSGLLVDLPPPGSWREFAGTERFQTLLGCVLFSAFAALVLPRVLLAKFKAALDSTGAQDDEAVLKVSRDGLSIPVFLLTGDAFVAAVDARLESLQVAWKDITEFSVVGAAGRARPQFLLELSGRGEGPARGVRLFGIARAPLGDGERAFVDALRPYLPCEIRLNDALRG